MNRRDWLIACGQLAGGVTMGLSAPGCVAPPGAGPLPAAGVDGDTIALPPDYLCATFEPTQDSVIAWLCSRAPTVAHLEIWPDGEVEPRRAGTVELTETTGLAVAASFRELTPNTEHRYRAFFEGAGYGPWLRFRTSPEVDALEAVSFLFSADVGIHPKLDGTYAVLASEEVPLYVHLGDWPYADQAPAARSLAEFRDKHRIAREPYAIQEWLWSTPVVAIYDDHDIKENWAGMDLADENPELLSAGISAWHEFFPIGRETAFRDVRWGKLAHFFIVDTRLFRDKRSSRHQDWAFLGDGQLAWLTTALRESNAAFKILVSTVPFGFDGYEDDDWSAFPADRAEVLRAVREAQIDPLIVISGDRHWFAARHLEDGVREYQVGPLTAGLGKYPDSFPTNVAASALTRNFGRIDIDADLVQRVARLTFTCIDIDGAEVYTEYVESPLDV